MLKELGWDESVMTIYLIEIVLTQDSKQNDLLQTMKILVLS